MSGLERVEEHVKKLKQITWSCTLDFINFAGSEMLSMRKDSDLPKMLALIILNYQTINFLSFFSTFSPPPI